MKPETRLRSIFTRCDRRIKKTRDDESSMFLAWVAGVMERRRIELDIPIRSVKVISYLASQPSAMIFRDPVTEEAFENAMRAVSP
jgi:hypothetical protein